MKLSEITNPEDIKNLSIEELKTLAEEIRHKIIDVMAVNGGHLGSNMGIVELMLALHMVFDSPKDKFIFDVSHQVYVHKLLTGRYDQFHTIRQYKGLSGFANPEESEHDHFYAGHAATALSLSLGVAKSRDLSNETGHILPIVGDATFTCGLAFEALNNIPKKLTKFIAVLNDNDMAISTNVGNIANILGQKAKTSKPFFEQHGMRYVGPIDGHNIEELITTLESVKNADEPILLHVLTVKGKGLEIAENNPIPWHGCAPFDKVTGEKLAKASAKPTFPKIFGKYLHEMAEKDPNIVTVNPATPLGSAIIPLMDQFPERTFDVGIAEGHAVTFSGGAAKNPKMKIVCSIYATFLQRAFDNLFHDVCLQKSPVVFGIDRAGIGTGDGPTHHGIYDISFLNAMPNMVITQPRDGHVLKELLESAFDYKRPTAIRYPNMGTDEGAGPIHKRPLGKGEILSQGSDVAIIALGHMCDVALDAQKYLAAQNLSVTVVDPVFVKPLDTDLLANIFLSHKQVVTLEEHAVTCGLGSIINTFAIRNGFGNIPIRNFGIPDTFFHQGSLKEMHKIFGMDAESVARQILKDYAEEIAYENSPLST